MRTSSSVVSAAAIVVALGFGDCAEARENAHLSRSGQQKFEIYDPKMFDRSTAIDNKWMPMIPGMRWVYEGTTVEDDGKVVPHRIEITVTDLTKTINGVRTLVSYDLDYSDGDLEEAELAFYAQDKYGNVWRFGEYPEEYDDEKVAKAPTWIDGIEGARAGVMMMADPQLGDPSYAQGWGPAVNWTDRGQVHKVGQKTSVPAGNYDNVLVIAETAESEPNAMQLKYYVKGLGNVRVGWAGAGEKTQEVLELVKFERLGPQALAEIRAKAQKLEQSGYKVSKNVFGRTPPSTVVAMDQVAKDIGMADSSSGGRAASPAPMGTKISDDELKAIAVKAVPGRAVDVSIEKKLGANRYVVEVLSDADGGAEVDVIIDMETHRVLGIDK